MSVAASSPSALPSGVDAVIAQMPHAVWHADRMASYPALVVPTGYPALDKELPNSGWPHSALIELLMQQPGIGEMQLLRPALNAIASQRRIALIQPPHVPQIAAWSEWGLPADRLLWVRAGTAADALWSAEQILRNGSCGAMLLWQTHCSNGALRRLHLAAQETNTVFWLIRSLDAAQEASPAPLRLGLQPANGGIDITFVKRRGPHIETPLHLPLPSLPFTSVILPLKNHALLDRSSPAAASIGSLAAVLE